MDISKIAVKNYQSLYDISLLLGRFTVVFGDSDVGKSALYRAIRALVTAESGDSFISKGTNRAGVSLTLVDEAETEIVWVKPKGKRATYYLRVGGTKIGEWVKATRQPRQVAEILKFDQLDVDGDKFYPNFRGQFDPLFMLFESSSKRARILGSLISNILLKGIKRANLERNRTEADIRAMSDLAEGFDKKLEFDWGDVERKLNGLRTVALNLEAQHESWVDLRARSLERYLCISYASELDELGSDRLLYEMDVVISGMRLQEELVPLVNRYVQLQKMLAFKYTPLDSELFDNVARMEEMCSWLGSKMTKCKLLARDIALGGLEVQRHKKELIGISQQIKKLEKERTVTCPKCGEVFQWQK